jgi:hypothetical protein
MSEWSFQDRTGIPTTEPIQGEFFAGDVIEDTAAALVREGIQNALDAGTGGTVRVRIFLSDRESAVSGPDSRHILQGLHPHLRADRSGIREDQRPGQNTEMPYLLFEDFGTCGLTGDSARATRPEDPDLQDNFYYFFRHDGHSAKNDTDLGSWGIGKFVFYRASRINTIVALTVQQDTGRKLLFGHSILRSHYLEQPDGNRTYHLDGYFGMEAENIARGFRIPIDSPEEIDAFTGLLDTQRGDEPGLSVLVPYPDEEITPGSIRKSVIRDYFYPIVKGDLVVDLDLEGNQRLITSETIAQEIQSLGEADFLELLPIIKLARWSIENGDQERITLQMPDPGKAPNWNNEVVTEEMVTDISERLKVGESVSIRVPVTLRPTNQDEQETFFDLFLTESDNTESKRPVFLRQGIIITAARSLSTRRLHSMIVISDTAMASFIRKSENPSHTEVNHSRLRFDYINHRSSLLYVLGSVRQLNRLLSEADEEENFELLSDFFSDKAIEDPRVRTRTRVTGPQPGPPDLEPRDNWYDIGQIKRGFSLTAGDELDAADLPRVLVIQTGYDRRRRNAITAYKKQDYDLGNSGSFEVESSGCEVIERNANQIRLRVNEADFKLTVQGFNENRQVVVKVNKAGDTE